MTMQDDGRKFIARTSISDQPLRTTHLGDKSCIFQIVVFVSCVSPWGSSAFQHEGSCELDNLIDVLRLDLESEEAGSGLALVQHDAKAIIASRLKSRGESGSKEPVSSGKEIEVASFETVGSAFEILELVTFADIFKTLRRSFGSTVIDWSVRAIIVGCWALAGVICASRDFFKPTGKWHGTREAQMMSSVFQFLRCVDVAVLLPMHGVITAAGAHAWIATFIVAACPAGLPVGGGCSANVLLRHGTKEP